MVTVMVMNYGCCQKKGEEKKGEIGGFSYDRPNHVV